MGPIKCFLLTGILDAEFFEAGRQGNLTATEFEVRARQRPRNFAVCESVPRLLCYMQFCSG